MASMMSPKERTQKALLNQPVDRLPTQLTYTNAFGQELANYFDVLLEHLPIFLENHLRRIDLTYRKKVGQDGRASFDWWGVGFDRQQEGYAITFSPLAEEPNLDAYDWPDPHMPHLFEQARMDIKAFGKRYFIIPNLGFALFERAWSLRGFEQFLLDMATDPVYTAELLDRITEIQLILVQRFLELGVDGGYFGDDYGAQKNLLFSPKMWRNLIKPRLARLFAPFVERSLPIILHSDGQIQEILPDLVEIGLTTLNPVQPEVLSHDWLMDTYGGTLSFYGGVSTQTILPNGTKQEVVAAVAKAIDSLAPDGTGLLIAPSHRMMSDIPLENATTLIQTFKEIGHHD